MSNGECFNFASRIKDSKNLGHSLRCCIELAILILQRKKSWYNLIILLTLRQFLLQIVKQKFCDAGQMWWHMLLLPALGKQRQGDLWVWGHLVYITKVPGQPGLQRERDPVSKSKNQTRDYLVTQMKPAGGTAEWSALSNMELRWERQHRYLEAITLSISIFKKSISIILFTHTTKLKLNAK